MRSANVALDENEKEIKNRKKNNNKKKMASKKRKKSETQNTVPFFRSKPLRQCNDNRTSIDHGKTARDTHGKRRPGNHKTITRQSQDNYKTITRQSQDKHKTTQDARQGKPNPNPNPNSNPNPWP